jgi:hypothetical protein
MIRTCWSDDICCELCGHPIGAGIEMMRSNGSSWTHPLCMKDEILRRRDEEVTCTQAFNDLIRQYAGTGNVIVSSRQLRQIIEFVLLVLPDFEPVHSPDLREHSRFWFGKIAGWNRSRVSDGSMPVQEIIGFWMDHLDVGRKPPVRRDALTELLSVLEKHVGRNLVWRNHSVALSPEPSEEVLEHTDEEIADMIFANIIRTTPA